MNEDTKETVTALQAYLTHERTVCFGRFLIDVPNDAEIIYGAAEVHGSIEYIEGGAESISERIHAQLSLLEAERYIIGSRSDQIPKYGTVIDGTSPGQRIVFGSKNYVLHSLTSYIPKPPHLFIHSINVSLDDGESTEKMNRIANALQIRSLDRIPTEAGICIDGGFIPGESQSENIYLGVRMKRYPDVHMSIRTTRHPKYLPVGALLEERIRETEQEATPFERVWLRRIKFLRRGPRKLAAWDGEEVLARLPAQRTERESHQFLFASLGEVNNSLAPEISIELVSGVRGNRRGSETPSLSDEQMLTLWDKLTSSIRIRSIPSANRSDASSHTKADIALATGQLCPQTGWWECRDADVLAGSKRLYIRAGERLPYVSAANRISTWDKLMGVRQVSTREAVWHLASDDKGDGTHSLK